MADKIGLPLTDIEGFSAEAAARLAELWITTAEELVSAARQEAGPQGLTIHLGLGEYELAVLLELAVAALPDDVSFAPDDELEVSFGALDEDEGDDPADEPVSFAEPLPAEIDLRVRMPPVRDQRDRGTCVAFATVAVREFLTGAESSQGDLSEQFQYWNCKKMDNFNGSGTWIKYGMAALQEDGVCPEQVWPYNPDMVPGSEDQGPPPADAAAAAKKYRISKWIRLQPRWINNLRTNLANGTPIAFSVPVYKYWLTEPVRSTGDIRLPLSTDKRVGGHAMCMVGYEDDQSVPGGGYFKVRNSWGTSTWGKDSQIQSGHARIPYAYMTQYGRSAYTAAVREDLDENGDHENSNWLLDLWRRIFGS